MRRVLMMIAVASVFAVVSFAEVNISGSAALQVTKKNEQNSVGRIDDSWVRGEVKVAGSLESGLSGMVHLRTEPKLTSDVKSVALQPRQVFLKLPVCMVDLMAGRWYEVYGAGNYYFGQYLFGVGTKKGVLVGNGSMNTDYKVIDGFKATLNLKSIESALHLAVLPGDSLFEATSLMAMLGGCPIEGLKYTIAGNLQILTPDNKDPVHRATINCGYTIMKERNLGVFGEVAVVNLDDVNNNVWFLMGFCTKVPKVLDRLQAEFEIKNHRNGDPKPINSLQWMVMLRKKFKELCFDLNVGTDAAGLGSDRPCEFGAIFRTTASF